MLVGLDDEGERTFTFMVRPSADLFLSESDLPAFAAGEGLHLCSIALSAEPSRSAAFSAMRRIRRAGGWVSFDPNLREDLWRDAQAMRSNVAEALRLADIIKLSLEELHYLTDSSDLHRASHALPPPISLRCCSLPGKAGVTLWRNGETQHFPARR